MDFSSDDSAEDPNFLPDNDFSDSDTSSSDENDNLSWNPPGFSRRLSTFSERDMPLLPEIQRRRSARQVASVDLEQQRPNVPSASGTTDAGISEQEWVREKSTNMQWELPSHNDPPAIDYAVPSAGMKDIYVGILANADPIDYFDLFLTPDIVDHITDQTNLYATQHLLSSDSSAGSRNHLWTPVTKEDMLKFLALVGWMGLVKLPQIKDYWRNNKLYGIPLARKVMPRNRFELILKFIHFADNQTADTDDRLYKIKYVIDRFVANYKNVYTPGEKICVDESLVAWRGRLIFRQYIPNKRAKYGIKIFKLCTEKGYTWNLIVYCGKSREPDTEVSEKVVLTLVDGLLNEGRTMYTDNYYTSVPLALRLRKRKTHLVGTLRSNRKYLPKNVTSAKLKKGEIAAQQSGDGIVVLKWRDKRDVLMLTTKQSGLKTVTKRNRRGESITKPACIEDYNNGKSSIDISDQMATYGSALRRCTKWYRKLMFEIIWGTSLVNAHFLYNQYTLKKKLTITEFREQVITGLLERSNTTIPVTPSRVTSAKHYLVTNIKDGIKKKARCSECYNKYGRGGKMIDGKLKKACQVITTCSVCKVPICKNCFNEVH